MSATASRFYVTGGTLRHDAASYAARRADTDLYEGLTRGEFCYVLTSRQMGKSSLMVRTALRLREEGVAVAALDLTRVGQNLSPQQWYDGLLALMGQQLDLEEELEAFWLEHLRLGPLQRWLAALRELVLARVPGRIAIFVDEIDTVRSLPFSTDEFFAGIRECYNRRTQDPAFERLTFCLLGVATPSELIRDSRRTPFNIGQRIDLTDFSPTEAAPLAQGMADCGLPIAECRLLLQRVLYWTGGHPYLTQCLCQAVSQEVAADPQAAIGPPQSVDRHCEALFLSRQAQERDDNLLFVREWLLRSEAHRAALLELYAQVRSGLRVPADDTDPLQALLRLSGIIRMDAEAPRVRIPIYARVFDREWVAAHLPSRETFANNLPVSLTRFVGRGREIAEVRQLLGTASLLTLTGAGGCGKTRLALQVAAELAGAFPGGVWLVEFAALAEPALVPQSVASSLGVKEEPGRAILATLCESLQGRRLLLVLDNCEHLLSACAELAAALLQGCPKLQILTTSREALGLLGEQAYRVPSLSTPDPGSLPPLERLYEFESVELFVDRAALSQPSFVLTAANAATVAQVCQRLDGIPLAIELAAARVKAMSVEQINARIADMFRLLTGGSRTALPRQQTLRAAIDWSYDLLSEKEKILLRRLSVFTGGWTLEAAEQVGADPEEQRAVNATFSTPPAPIENWEVLDLLTSLVQKSLVVYEEDEQGQSRYHLLEPMRQYARDRLLEAGEGEAVRDRHGQFCLGLAEAAHAASEAGKGAEGFERLETEHDNLRTALEWSQERGAEGTLRLAGALGAFWFERGYWNEACQWLEGTLAAGTPPAEPTEGRAWALALAGRLAANRHDFTAARNRLEESVAQYRLLGDTRGLVEALVYLSEVNQWWGTNPATAPMLEEAVALARTVGDPRLLSMALCGLGLATRELGTAHMLLAESLALARQLGDGALIAQSLWILGNKSAGQGDWARARELLEECVSQARAAKNYGLVCRALADLADVVEQQGDPERAKSLREEQVNVARERQTGLLVAEALAGLAAHAPSDEEALQWLAQSVRECGPGVIVGTLNEVAQHAPSYEAALRTVDQAARDYGPEVTFNPLACLGDRARRQGDYERAATCYRRMLVLSQQVGGPFGFLRTEVGGSLGIAQSLEDLASLAARQQQWERAATLLGAAEGVCVAMGRTPPVASAEEYERAVRGARAALGEEAFAAAWAEGRARSPDQAVEFALEDGSDDTPDRTR